jgi:hypothetical protein
MPSINDLSSATQNGNVQEVKKHLGCEKIKTRLKSLPDSSETRSTLHIAAERGHIECVKILLDSKLFNINAECKDGRSTKTALDLAAKNNHIAVVQLLLDNGANINGAYNTEISHFKGNWSPLHFAAYYNHIELVDLLLSYPNIDVNLCVNPEDTAKHGTPLDFALDQGNFRIAYKILMHKLHKLRFNPLLWLVGLAGVSLLAMGVGALLGWSVMASLLPITSVAIAVTAIGGLLLTGSLIYRFGDQLKQICLSCFKDKEKPRKAVGLEQTTRKANDLALPSTSDIEPDATLYSRLYAQSSAPKIRNATVARTRRNSM